MSKIIDWLKERKERRLARYDEVKKEIEELVGNPKISITLELPEELKAYKTEFVALETNAEFQREIQKMVEKKLINDKL